MHLGARIQAAIEVVGEIEGRHRPATEALRDWGRSHRFAGSADRAVIGNLVFDCLRRRRSLAARLGDDGERLAVIAVPVMLWDEPVEQVAELCAREHGPGALSDADLAALVAPATTPGSTPVRGDFPDWLEASFERVFGPESVDQARALSDRAPIDLRVNTLKAERPRVLNALSRHRALETPFAPDGVRIPAPVAAGRYPNVEAEAAHGRGWFEVQDEGSQVAAVVAGTVQGNQVMDLCAGSGGKSLALSAAMENRGQIYAYDDDRARLRRIFDRLRRAGARNVQVLDAGEPDRLRDLDGRMDVVFIDAPCSGSGTWRRRPDAKWRLRADALERRCREQAEVLELGAPLARPGGRLVYVTCSLLPEENADQVASFLDRHREFRPVPWRDTWPEAGGLVSSAKDPDHLLLTPLTHGTDGFFVAVLERAGAG